MQGVSALKFESSTRRYRIFHHVLNLMESTHNFQIQRGEERGLDMYVPRIYSSLIAAGSNFLRYLFKILFFVKHTLEYLDNSTSYVKISTDKNDRKFNFLQIIFLSFFQYNPKKTRYLPKKISIFFSIEHFNHSFTHFKNNKKLQTIHIKKSYKLKTRQKESNNEGSIA